jgi:VWFA-related protein
MRALVLALLSSALLLAQQTPQQTPVFRGGITIVPLTVTVLDKNGKPVTDLTQRDFTILEDGARQEIKTFAAEELRPQPPPAHEPPTLVRPARFADAAPSTRRTFLLVLGYGRIQYPAKGLDGAMAFIREHLLPQDFVAVIGFNRASNFTTEHEAAAQTIERYKQKHEAIISAIDTFYDFPGHRGMPLPDSIQADIDSVFQEPGRPAPPRSVSSMLFGSEMFVKVAQQAETRAQNTYGAMPSDLPWDARVVALDLLKAYAGIEYLRYLDGEKHLVWIIQSGMGQTLAGTPWSVQDDEQLAARSGDAGVVTDIIHTGGIPMPVSRGRVGMPSLASMDSIQSSENIAELTGGQFTGVSYAEAALSRIDAATRFNYVLGYTPIKPELDGKFRKISVKVNRPGVTVLYRHGYSADEDVRPLDLRTLLTTSRLASAASGDQQSRDIKIDAKASVVSGIGMRRAVVDMTIDASRITFSTDGDRRVAALDVRVFVGDDKERPIGETSENIDLSVTEAEQQTLIKNGIRYAVRVPITGEPKYAKVVVYDYRADLLGTATIKIK